jgi:hypothetical protein
VEYEGFWGFGWHGFFVWKGEGEMETGKQKQKVPILVQAF